MARSTELARILKLSVAERIQLVEDVWDSIADEGDDALPVPAEHLAELDRRLAARKSRKRPTRTWDDVKSDLLKKL